MDKKESRRNEAIAFIDEELAKMEIESEGYIVVKVTDNIYHNLNYKLIKENFSRESDNILSILSSLIDRKLQMPDFICKHLKTNQIIFVEFKDWYKTKFKLSQVEQKKTLSEISRLGGYLVMIINKPSLFKIYEEYFKERLPLNEEIVEKILYLKRKFGTLTKDIKQILNNAVPKVETKGYKLIDDIRE
ncbi:hypothetical protein FJZ19_02430 [Candidatus Pacearchaeota archaeon]|nr:hypothetical protein [Candidatus Pacearchaeota archaeon]